MVVFNINFAEDYTLQDNFTYAVELYFSDFQYAEWNSFQILSEISHLRSDLSYQIKIHHPHLLLMNLMKCPSY